MQVGRGSERLDVPPRVVLTIGNFDGVHQGHRALIDATRGLAHELGTHAAALTFPPSPSRGSPAGSDPPRLQTLEQRLACLQEAGLDMVVVEPFTHELSLMPPEEFADELLVHRLRAQGLALGHDFRFGRGRAGTVGLLKERLSIPVRQVAAVMHDGAPISSSRIRAALAEGQVAVAAELLGRQHQVAGTVEHGDKRGRTLGFPTANLGGMRGLIPADGVYAVRTRIGHDWWSSVANIGSRPTFEPPRRSVEVHVIDYRGPACTAPSSPWPS